MKFKKFYKISSYDNLLNQYPVVQNNAMMNIFVYKILFAFLKFSLGEIPKSTMM